MSLFCQTNIIAQDTGFTDGMLSVKVRTRNGAGITSGSPLCINFGALPPSSSASAGQPSSIQESTPVKKFRGTLENYFQESPQSTTVSPGKATVTGQDWYCIDLRSMLMPNPNK